jgi:peptidyl-tRNA hydrolase, PTH1 family
MPEIMWLIVGLGNPGLRYARTRHNLGFMVIDRLGKEAGISVSESVCHCLTAQAELERAPLMLAKPQTYMNRSGSAVACLTGNFDIPLTSTLVVVDDFALPLGKLRLRLKGSDGGHNGLKSIIEAVDSKEFPRLRMGIGPSDGSIEDPVDFVLSGFRREETELVESMIDRAQVVIRTILGKGMQYAMTQCN